MAKKEIWKNGAARRSEMHLCRAKDRRDENVLGFWHHLSQSSRLGWVGMVQKFVGLDVLEPELL